MKAKKVRKIILSFALSAALLAEPLAGTAVVRAEEIQTADQLTGGGSNPDDIAIDDQTGSSEENKQENPGDSDVAGSSASGQTDSESENPGKGDDGAEEDNSQENPDNPSEEGSDGETDEPTETPEGLPDAEMPEENGDPEDKTLLEAEEEKDNQDGFSDMPSGYKLTPFQKELKKDLGSILKKFDENGEGEAYAEREVFTFAESREEAEMIADAYHAEIKDFSNGVLVLKLQEDVGVKSALMVAADTDNRLPAVWPNYRRELYGEITPEEVENEIAGLEVQGEEYFIEGEEAAVSIEDDVPTLEAYGEALNELTAYGDLYLQPANESYQWFHTTIGSIYAWDAGYQGQEIRVGVIDSGVDENSDLEGNVEDRRDFSGSSNTYDNTGNGGKHGTHVAGIIAALQNDRYGVGVAPQAKIYNAKVFGTDETKSGYDSTIAAAIMYLINEDNLDDGNPNNKEPLVDVINMSLGGPGENPGMEVVIERAYQKGVAVFAATGNDGGSLTQYPASYNHVIGVAATDANNERASFSNYGASTDLAAPGVNIWATYESGYRSLQGTSMACPVAAGEAAVILSGADALSALAGKTGRVRVDELEKIMKANTISAGSGMGKGITVLPKVFKLSTASAKPNAPKITFKDTSNDTAQSLDITIEAQAGMQIYYTTNGKNPIFKNGEAGGDTLKAEPSPERVTISVDGSQAAKGTVKAMAVNASGVASAVTSKAYTLKPYVKTITISGPLRVERGKTIQLTAAVAPAYATKKTVTWDIKSKNGEAVDAAQIRIDSKNGRITTTVNAEAGARYTVTATAQDRQDVPAVGIYTVEIADINTAVQTLAFDKKATKELWIKTTPTDSTLSLADFVTAMEKVNGKNQPIEDRTALAERLVWSSSKEAVATVDQTGKVTARLTGTTVITVKADDNLARKATLTITVKQAVTGIDITTDNNYFNIAAGKTMALKAVITPLKPANKNINWIIEPAAGTDASIDDMKKIVIGKTNGRITVKAGAIPGTYTVTATAADGQGAIATKNIKVVAGAIGAITIEKKAVLSTTASGDDPVLATVEAMITGVKGQEGSFDPKAYRVTSSNEKIVKITELSDTVLDDGTIKIAVKVEAAGEMFGKANIVIASTDGSNKKAICVAEVKGGISKVELRDDSQNKISKLTLFRAGTASTAPSTATLNTWIEGTAGANLQAYKVSSNNEALVHAELNKVSGTGKITLQAGRNATGKATITLEATDGSKKKATCVVTVVNPPSRINIAPKGGAGEYVAYGKSLQLTALIETEYGAVSSKNVEWSVRDNVKNIVNVSKSGKVTVAKLASGQGGVPVTAKATDGSGIASIYYVYVVPPTTYIQPFERISGYGVSQVYFTSDCMASMTVSSSAPKVASPTISYSPGQGLGVIKYVPNRRGTTTFTIKAMDGTNKTCKYTIKVQ